MNPEIQEKLVVDRRSAAVVSVTPQASMPIDRETCATTENAFPAPESRDMRCSLVPFAGHLPVHFG